MAELTPNLDDGELWLPSDIIRDLDYVEDLARARQLAALGFLDGASQVFPNGAFKLPPPPPSNLVPARRPEELKPLRPAGPYGLVDREVLAARFVYDGFGYPSRKVGMLPAGGNAGFSRPGVVQYGFLEPVHAQMEGFGLERVQMLQRTFRPVQARFVPIPVAGGGREYGGTGVFLPRVAMNNNNHVSEVKKKHHVKGGEHMKQNAAVRKQQGAFQSPTEMGLPPDWTY